MHILGKIFAWLLVIGAGASTTLMSRQLQIRNTYTKKLSSLEKDNAASAKEIAKKEKILANLDLEYARVMAESGAYWDKRFGSRFQDQNNPALNSAFEVGIGTDQGIGNAVSNPGLALVGNETYKNQLGRQLHIFQILGPKSSRYVGPFEIPASDANIRNDGVRMVARWKLRAGELNSWTQLEDGYRYRKTIPDGYPSNLQSYYLKIAGTEENIDKATANLVERKNELSAAQDEVTRYRELVVGADGASGILSDLDTEDENRNQLQGAVDALRREVKQSVDLRAELLKAIRELADSLK